MWRVYQVALLTIPVKAVVIVLVPTMSDAVFAIGLLAMNEEMPEMQRHASGCPHWIRLALHAADMGWSSPTNHPEIHDYAQVWS